MVGRSPEYSRKRSGAYFTPDDVSQALVAWACHKPSATCLVLMEYGGDIVLPDADVVPPADGILEPGPELEDEAEEVPEQMLEDTIDEIIKGLPKVTVIKDPIPTELSHGLFLGEMVSRVLRATPVNMVLPSSNLF